MSGAGLERSDPVTIGLLGRGRLATAIADHLADRPERGRVLWSVGRDQVPGEPVDVAIDASVADAVEGHVDWALETSTALVIGATGWEIPDLQERVGDEIGLLVAPNFSLGAALLRRLSSVLSRYAAQEPERDPYVLEHHHRHKADAPSGTARSLAETVLDGCPRKKEWVLVTGPVEPHQLGVASVRAGAEFGSHTVGVDAPAETLEVRHRARSRETFAAGALAAVEWLRDRKGMHSFDDVVADLLDPLFELHPEGDLHES